MMKYWRYIVVWELLSVLYELLRIIARLCQALVHALNHVWKMTLDGRDAILERQNSMLDDIRGRSHANT